MSRRQCMRRHAGPPGAAAAPRLPMYRLGRPTEKEGPMTRDEYRKALELYLQDPYLGLEYYQTARGEGDASAEDWEEAVLAEIASRGEAKVMAEAMAKES